MKRPGDALSSAYFRIKRRNRLLLMSVINAWQIELNTLLVGGTDCNLCTGIL